MKGSECRLIEYMEGSKKRFIIPVYQRNYDWKTENCKQLYDDLIKVIKHNRRSHFFGSLVSVYNPSGRNTEFLVIDGQQRLTTVLLLNFILCKNFIKFNDEFNFKETLKYCVLGNKTTREDCPRIINNDYPIIDCIYDYCTRKEISCTFEAYLNQLYTYQ